MKNDFELMEVLQRKQKLENELNSLLYGAPEIREKNNNKYR